MNPLILAKSDASYPQCSDGDGDEKIGYKFAFLAKIGENMRATAHPSDGAKQGD